MLAELNSLFVWAGEFTKANPVIAGLVGVWGLGVVTFALKDIPSAVYAFVKRQLTTTLVLNSQDDAFFEILEWVSKNHMHSFVRTLNINNKKDGYGKMSGLSIGYGRIFFTYKRRIFTMERSEDRANQTEKTKEKIFLTVLGRNQGIFTELLSEVRKSKTNDAIYTRIYTWKYGAWNIFVRNYKRDLESVVIDSTVKRDLLTHIDSFRKSKEWYRSNGIPYRTGIMLMGPPGTGKTSLIKALAAKYDSGIYSISLNTVNDTTLLEAMAKVPEGGFISIEDIDGFGLNLNREKKKSDDDDDFDPSGEQVDKALTMSGILNAIDGAMSSENHVLIITSNHPDRLDPALLRAGRIDLKLELGYMTKPMLCEYLARFFPGFVVPGDFKMPDLVPACDVQKLVFDNRDNPANIIAELKKL